MRISDRSGGSSRRNPVYVPSARSQIVRDIRISTRFHVRQSSAPIFRVPMVSAWAALRSSTRAITSSHREIPGRLGYEASPVVTVASLEADDEGLGQPIHSPAQCTNTLGYQINPICGDG